MRLDCICSTDITCLYIHIYICIHNIFRTPRPERDSWQTRPMVVRDAVKIMYKSPSLLLGNMVVIATGFPKIIIHILYYIWIKYIHPYIIRL